MKQNKILTALGFALSETNNTVQQEKPFLKRIVQLTAITVSCMVALPSFAQNCPSGQSDCHDDGEVISWGNGNTPIEDWSWVSDPHDGNNGDDGDDGDSGGSDNDDNSNYDPIVCNSLINGDNNPNYVPGNPNAPQWCSSDPGSSANLNYNEFITSYLGAILGDLTGPCTDGCFWSNNYPYMTTPLVNQVINLFGDAYYNSLDYISARNTVWNLLTQTCENNYQSDISDFNNEEELGLVIGIIRGEFNQCMGSQADFYFSMTPLNSASSSSWTASLGYQAPWGGSLSFGYNSSGGANTNWVADFLIDVSKKRQCHTWYQALDAANCPTP